MAQGSVEFDAVSYQYSAGAPVLKAVSFACPGGQTLALVGATGARARPLPGARLSHNSIAWCRAALTACNQPGVAGVQGCMTPGTGWRLCCALHVGDGLSEWCALRRQRQVHLAQAHLPVLRPLIRCPPLCRLNSAAVCPLEMSSAFPCLRICLLEMSLPCLWLKEMAARQRAPPHLPGGCAGQRAKPELARRVRQRVRTTVSRGSR